MAEFQLEVYALLLLATTTVATCCVYIPVPLHMLIASMVTIFVGSMGALRASDKKVVEDSKVSAALGSKDVHRMSRSDVYASPIIGSAVLFGLYIVYKFCPKDYVNILVKLYFGIFGVFSIGEQVGFFIMSFFIESQATKKVQWLHRKLLSIPYLETDVTALDAIGCLAGSVIGGWYLLKNHWVANNIFGVAFSLQAIRMLSIGSYFNGTILLSGLFVYDIFWVFGTDVMVTVAKSFDGPIKLLFPRWIQDDKTGKWMSSILGLGDIVLPGIFIALLLRFDRYRLSELNRVGGGEKTTQCHHRSSSGLWKYKYFCWAMGGYALGLAITIAVMNAFNAAQPALLYLVPCCIGASIVKAVMEGELKELWNYEEKDEGDTDPDSGKQINSGKAHSE
eukprot:jgi/Bigna1/85384/estExt_fgenesh1_pg.C_30408